MRHCCWPCVATFLCLVLLGIGTVRAVPLAYILRFADSVPVQDPAAAQPASLAVLPGSAPEVPANDWLKRNGWKQIWPLRLLGAGPPLVFAGPSTQRYLRLAADDDYYIWTRQLDLDPHAHPVLELTWGIERFPQGAALDVHDRTDRPLVVLVSFGPKVPSPGLMPSVPRGLAFFWGETETVGALYTCITPKNGPADVRLQCRYPHVKYIAVRRGAAGSVHTDPQVGIRLKRDSWMSVMYAEGLHSTTSSATLQRTDRHEILGQKPTDLQVSL